MRMPIPRLYLGTMTFGWSAQTSSVVDESVATEMVRHFLDHSDTKAIHYIDTARIYAGGKTEQILGSALRTIGSEPKYALSPLVVGTKAHPSQPEGLSTEGISQQFQASLNAMKLPNSASQVGEFYLHQPDVEHSLLESLQTAHHMITEGQITELGLSNYHASEVQRAFELCEQHGLTKPTVYQGLYNPLNRAVETELVPLLKKNNCRFIAYNPLAAGLLAGKHKRPSSSDNNSNEAEVKAGRFKNNPNYLPRFYTDANFDALDLIQSALQKEEGQLTMVEATYRWMLLHSALDASAGDGLLIGASSVAQLDENLAACAAAANMGPLSSQLVQAFDDAWKITEQAGCFPYWRSYSSDMPGRESLDHGASYSAIKK
uniref:NADP-dependent oxidoreductase domain-containing protein n=1 Tax=Attheya septentrionalis TaxID=420275 RepID=A0A7S2XP15_9STRA|mmetsp:Transcript_24811/g.44925  ORF Transcript_24811/g.44925 Transcript_24811/m.44925 type:complete len:375 (+) Transcript_24811:86-1210(+)